MVFNFQDIFTYLQSSKKIEHILAHSYHQVKYPFNKRGVYARNLPLFNKELYDLIFKLKRLPTVEEFEEHYAKKYLTRPGDNCKYCSFQFVCEESQLHMP